MRITLKLYAMLRDHLPPEADGQRRKVNELPLNVPEGATVQGVIQRIEARMVFDGGAYASTSSAVLLNAVTHTQGPYKCTNATVDGYAVRTEDCHVVPAAWLCHT